MDVDRLSFGGHLQSRGVRVTLLALVALVLGAQILPAAPAALAQPALSSGCTTLNHAVFDGEYQRGGLPGAFAFVAGERIRVTAAPPATPGPPTTMTLTVGAVVQTSAFPATITYVTPAPGTYQVTWRVENAATVTYHLACDHPLPTPPQLTLTATASPSPVVPAGQPLTWTFVITNTGSVPAPGTTFSATVPAGLRVTPPSTTPAGLSCTLTLAGQRASCALGTLMPNQAVTITIAATMQGVALGANLCTTGQVNAGTAGATVTRQVQACTRVGAPGTPDLVATLACAPTTRVPHEVATCTLTVTNQGDRAISLPGGVPFASVVETQRTGQFITATTAGTAEPPGYPRCVALVTGYNCAAPAGGDTLAVGASRTWQVSFRNACTGCAGGTLTLVGRADELGIIAERDETNNDSAPVTITYTL
jgi:uncharacterized repeat protein (TIGR01451 family)